jgi:hypothetical protein
MKVHVAWEHFSLTNVDIGSNIQLADFCQKMIFSFEIIRGLKKIESKRLKLLIFLSMLTNKSLLIAKYFFSWSKIQNKYL